MNPFQPNDPRFILWNQMQTGAAAPVPLSDIQRGAMSPPPPEESQQIPDVSPAQIQGAAPTLGGALMAPPVAPPAAATTDLPITDPVTGDRAKLMRAMLAPSAQPAPLDTLNADGSRRGAMAPLPATPPAPSPPADPAPVMPVPAPLPPTPVPALAPQPTSVPTAPNVPANPLANYRMVTDDDIRAAQAHKAAGTMTAADRNAARAYAYQHGFANDVSGNMALEPENAPATSPSAGALAAKPGVVSGDAAELQASLRGDTAAVNAAVTRQNPQLDRPALTIPASAPPQSGAGGGDSAAFSQIEGKYGLPAGYLGKIGAIESGNGRNMVNPYSAARGYFQFMPGTAKAMGLSDPMDTAASADAAARLAVQNRNGLAAGLGIKPEDVTGAQLYLAHQQGVGGALKLLKNPDASAASLIGEKAANANGGANLTGGQMASKWMSAYDRAVMGQGRGLPGKDAPMNQGPGSGGSGSGGALSSTPMSKVVTPKGALAAMSAPSAGDDDTSRSTRAFVGALGGGGSGGSPIQFANAEDAHAADLSLSSLIKRRGKAVKGALSYGRNI